MERTFLAIINENICITFKCKLYSTKPAEIMKQADFVLFIILNEKNIAWYETRLRIIFEEEDFNKYDINSEQFIICHKKE